MIRFPQHAPIPFFDVRDDQLCIRGHSAAELAERAGHTPLYVYDSAAIAARIGELRQAVPTEFKLHFAIKANPMPGVVNFVAPLVDGLDVASQREMQTALASGMAAHEISFAGPGKRMPELEAAVAAGVLLNVESPAELERLAQISRASGRRARVAIRVNPDFELKTSGMKMSGGPKPFGIDAEQVPALLAGPAMQSVDFCGFHIFAGSQNLRVEAIEEAQTKSLQLAIQLARHAPRPPRILNLGGGFGIHYFPREERLDLAAIGQRMRALVPVATRELPGCELVIELGRYIVGEAGVYLARVLDCKKSRDQWFVVTDGGLHHHLAASGNFGQVVRKNYPVANASRMYDGTRETVSVVGPLCTPLDILGAGVEIGRPEPGDLIAVFQSGAYGLTASPLGFLSHPEPAEILL